MSKEKIVCAAIKVQGAGKKWDGIYLGLRHADCFSAMSERRALFSKNDTVRVKMLRNNIQGFLTTKNRFVDRYAACIIAMRENQITYKHGSEDELYSEDIY